MDDNTNNPQDNSEDAAKGGVSDPAATPDPSVATSEPAQPSVSDEPVPAAPVVNQPETTTAEPVATDTPSSEPAPAEAPGVTPAPTTKDTTDGGETTPPAGGQPTA